MIGLTTVILLMAVTDELDMQSVAPEMHGEFVAPVCQVYPADYRDTIIVGDVIRGEPNRDVEGSQGCVIESVIGAGFSTDQVSAIRIGVNSDGYLIRCGRTPHGVGEGEVAICGIVQRFL